MDIQKLDIQWVEVSLKYFELISFVNDCILFLKEITPTVIRSKRQLKLNQWVEISAGRLKNGVGYIQVGDEAEITEPRLTTRTHSIYLKTNLYVGGYDKRALLNQGLDVSNGFNGCITGVSNLISFLFDC